jgi:predicted lipid-binding transport protein (Tim44 family)
MRTFLKLILILLAACALVTEDAAARRLGGGGSLGKQRPSYSQGYSREAAPQAPPSQYGAGAGTANRPQPGPNRWLGPLAGLAIGGLLGSMFFGHAFQGVQFLDLLVLAGLAFGIYYLFRQSRRATSTATDPAYRYAGTAPSAPTTPSQFEVPTIGSGLAAQPGSTVAKPAANLPAWFDEASFIKAAKTHFIRLQAAWDRNDMNDIREYTTPQLFAELSMERQEMPGPQHTEVVELNAELLDAATEGEHVLVSVRYSGRIREEEQGSAEPFSEIWHVQRELNNPKADWYIAGIQQT